LLFAFVDVDDCLLDELLCDFDDDDCPFFFPLSLLVFFFLSDLLFQPLDEVLVVAAFVDPFTY
jgi:hypothetical protein